MSRRFSTMDYSTKNSNDMTNDVRLKLAKIRARSRSICEFGGPPSPPSAPPPSLVNTSPSTCAEFKKSKRSSQVPRRRPSITAMTTSAQAKVRSPYTNNINDRPTENNGNFLSSPPTNTLEPNNNNNRRRHSTISNHHHQRINSTSTTQWNEDTTLIKFFDSDSDEDELFLRKTTNKVKSSQRYHHHGNANASVTHLDNADQNHTQSLRAELQELKSRITKLEKMRAPPPPPPSTSTSTGEMSRRSSMNSSSVLLSQPSLVDSACSVFKNRLGEALQDTTLHLDDSLNESSNKNTPYMDTLIALVAETMHMNQTLTSLASQQQVSSSDILAVKKSSDHQIKLLTETMQAFTDQNRQQQQQQQQQQEQQQQQQCHQQKQDHDQLKQQQQQVMDPLASPPLSPSGSINNHLDLNDSPKPSKHRLLLSSFTTNFQHSSSPPPSSLPKKSIRDQPQHNKSSLLSSSTGRKRNSSDSTTHSVRFKDHVVTPTKHKQTKSVKGIAYPQHYQQQQQQQQPFYSLLL